jgi:malonyl CoA-acyl carrier protein transacylase
MPILTRVLISLCVSVAAILAWRSYGGAARETMANALRELGSLAPLAQRAPHLFGQAAQGAAAPDQQRLNAISLDLETMRQNVDRITTAQEQITRIVNQLTVGQERIAGNMDQLAAAQELMTREIAKLQAGRQQLVHKNAESPPRPAALARNPAPRSPAVR